MSGISSGIGLLSGIPTADLIDQLIAIERRPIDNLQSRVNEIGTQRAAFLELSAQLLAAQNAVANFGRSSLFNRFRSTSTNTNILTATVDERAGTGSFTFRVRSLAATHSLMSRGFADADTTPVGTGTLTIEVGRGQVDQSTRLDSLRGGAGVRRGVITITDRGGGSADIDLSAATTIQDILNAINSNPAIHVRASVTGLAGPGGGTGDRIVISDLTDPALLDGTETLTVTDQGGGSLAADLGIAGAATSGRLDGADLVQLSSATPLSLLNDGNGVGRLRSGDDLLFSTTGGDFAVSLTDILATQLDTDLRMLNGGNGVRLGVIRITDRSGAETEIDLSSAQTVRDILDRINTSGLAVSATIVDSHFQVVDASGVSDADAKSLTIEDVTGTTAADLGLAQSVDDDAILGRDVYRIATIGDVIRAINFASANTSLVEASISTDGKGITLQALSPGSTVTVSAAAGSTAARDLGILDASFTDAAAFDSRRLIAGLDTVLLQSLNGGSGVQVGTVSFTDRAGNSSVIDFSTAETLQDVIDLINADPNVALVASINRAHNGIQLVDESGGPGDGPVIEDVTGSLASDLGLGVGTDPLNPFTGNLVNGGNAQLQYISRQTLLADLNGGRGVAPGSFQVTDSGGTILSVTLDADLKTVGEVIDRINTAGLETLQARINDTGDGILLTDTSGGSLALTVEDRQGGRAAADLRLAGTARTGENFIDGSFETRIEIDAGDTLQDVARKLNEAPIGLSASILHQGGAFQPVNLTLVSELSGRRGQLVVDSLGLDLGFTTLSSAQDAVVEIGDGTTTNPLLVSSPANTLENVFDGVTLNLVSAADEPVTVTVAQDIDGIVESVNAFVQSYNQVIDTLDRDTSFNPDTLARGPLLGDATVNLIRSRLARITLRRFGGADQVVSRLADVGIRLGDGGRLEFDEQQFRTTLQASPQLVEELFTKEDTGFGAVIQETLDDLTRNFDGLISRKNDLLSDQQDLLTDRIDRLNVLLDAKRSRLETQFAALESTIAALQQQQNALGTLTSLLG